MGLGTWVTSTSSTVGLVIPPGPNRAVEAAFTFEVRGADFTAFPVTCGGVAMHEMVGSPAQSPNGVARVRRFYLLDSELPAEGAQNVIASPTGGADVSYRSAAVVHTDVAQVIPTYIENGEDSTSALRMPADTTTWSYVGGQFATAVIAGGAGDTTFTWPAPWTERWDANDGANEARSTGGDRSYSGRGTDSVTVTASAAQRTAGSVLLWTSVPTDVVVTIAASGADYTSLAAAEAGEQRDIEASNERINFECGAILDAAVIFDGWTTGALTYIRVAAASGAEAQMPWSTSAYRAVSGFGLAAIQFNELHGRFERLQLEYNGARWANGGGIIWAPGAHDGTITVDGCLARNTGASAGPDASGSVGFGLSTAEFRKTAILRNCVAHGFAMNFAHGWHATESESSITLLNCTSHGESGSSGRGFWIEGVFSATSRIQNCLSSGCSTDFQWSSAATFSHNASSDATAIGTSCRASQAFTFVNASGNDYHLDVLDVGAKGYGVDLSTDFTTDFDGAARSTPWDIGADEVAIGTFSDTFTRADGSLGGAWETVTGAAALVIVSGAVRGASADQNCLVSVRSDVVPFNADQEAQVTYSALPGTGDFGGPAVRVDAAAGTGYFVEADGFNENTRGIYRLSGGVRTRISTVPIVPTAGSVVRLRIVGSVLVVYVNDVLLETITDTVLTSGQPGMYYWRGNTGGTMLDNFVSTDSLEFRAGFNFRATSGYVTDGNDDVPITDLNTITYPTTRGHFRYGYAQAVTRQTRDRNSALDPRLAGMHFIANNSAVLDFRVELPRTGPWEITLASGDSDSGPTSYVELYDGATLIATINSALTAGQYIDATGVVRTSAADWVSNNAPLVHNFVSTTLLVRRGGTALSSDTPIAHIGVFSTSSASEDGGEEGTIVALFGTMRSMFRARPSIVSSAIALRSGHMKTQGRTRSAVLSSATQLSSKFIRSTQRILSSVLSADFAMIGIMSNVQRFVGSALTSTIGMGKGISRSVPRSLGATATTVVQLGAKPVKITNRQTGAQLTFQQVLSLSGTMRSSMRLGSAVLSSSTLLTGRITGISRSLNAMLGSAIAMPAGSVRSVIRFPANRLLLATDLASGRMRFYLRVPGSEFIDSTGLATIGIMPLDVFFDDMKQTADFDDNETNAVWES